VIRSAVIALCFICSQPAAAQSPVVAAEGPVVVTVGEGIVKRAPDRAWVIIAAESRARNPRETQRLNSDAMSAVLQNLKSAGLAGDAIRTIAYDLHPEFDYANNRQTLRGYVARNVVEVRVDDLQRLGDILEGSVGAGATNVTGVRFDLKERAAAERDALSRAVADARGRADAAASGAGVKVERVIKIEEHRGGVPIPQPRLTMMRESTQAAGEPPMAPGEIEIRATVTLTASIR
jgi:uncharacterized protein YggE